MLIYLKYALSTLLGTLTMHKCCKKWDEKLNKLLDEHWTSAIEIGVEDLDSEYNYGDSLHTIQLGNCLVWVSNRYYSYGYLYQHRVQEGKRWGISIPDSEAYRCKVRTMARLDSLVKDVHKARNSKSKKNHELILQSIQP